MLPLSISRGLPNFTFSSFVIITILALLTPNQGRFFSSGSAFTNAMVCMEDEASTVLKEEGEVCGGPCNQHGRCKEGFHCVMMDMKSAESYSRSPVHGGVGQNRGHIRVNPSTLVSGGRSSVSASTQEAHEASDSIVLNSMVGVPTQMGTCQSKSTVELMWSRETHMDKEEPLEKDGIERQERPYRMENFADSNENMFSLFAKVTSKHQEERKGNTHSRSLLKSDIKESADQGLVGGLTTVDVEDEEVEKAASAAVDLMLSKKIIEEDEVDVAGTGKANVVVKEAYSQVVSGVKYYLVLALNMNSKNKKENFNVVILSQPWMDPSYTLLSVKEEGNDKELL